MTTTTTMTTDTAGGGDASGTARAVAETFCAAQATSAHGRLVATLERLLQADRRAFVKAYLRALNT